MINSIGCSPNLLIDGASKVFSQSSSVARHRRSRQCAAVRDSKRLFPEAMNRLSPTCGYRSKAANSNNSQSHSQADQALWDIMVFYRQGLTCRLFGIVVVARVRANPPITFSKMSAIVYTVIGIRDTRVFFNRFIGTIQ